jgi:hypothetical protein
MRGFFAALRMTVQQTTIAAKGQGGCTAEQQKRPRPMEGMFSHPSQSARWMGHPVSRGRLLEGKDRNNRKGERQKRKQLHSSLRCGMTKKGRVRMTKEEFG